MIKNTFEILFRERLLQYISAFNFRTAAIKTNIFLETPNFITFRQIHFNGFNSEHLSNAAPLG